MDGRFASLFRTAHTRIPENYLFQRGVACRSDGYQTRSSDRFSAPPTVRTPLFSPLFFVGSSFLFFFFSLRTPRTALFTVLFLFLFFFWFWFWFGGERLGDFFSFSVFLPLGGGFSFFFFLRTLFFLRRIKHVDARFDRDSFIFFFFLFREEQRCSELYLSIESN